MVCHNKKTFSSITVPYISSVHVYVAHVIKSPAEIITNTFRQTDRQTDRQRGEFSVG